MDRDPRRAVRPQHTKKWLATAAAVLVLAGCVNPTFRQSTAKFGELTRATVAAQNEQLTAVVAAEQERIRAELAVAGAELRVTGDCAIAVSPPVGSEPPVCGLQRFVGGRLVPIEQAPRYDHILALNAALADYAGSLATLAGDFSAGEARFTAAVTGVATSIGGLNNTIRSVSSQPSVDLAPKLQAVGNLVATLGNLYFAHRRNQVLKEIIIDGDAFVQNAVALLAGTDSSLRLYGRNQLYQQLLDAQEDLSRTIARHGSVAEVRAAQNVLYQRVSTFNLQTTDIRRFQAIGKAHAKLREAAESGVSPAELRQAIEALIELAGVAHETVTTLRQANGSADNAN